MTWLIGILLLLAGLLVLAVALLSWERVRAAVFADWNETILWGRLQFLVGAVLSAFVEVEPALVQTVIQALSDSPDLYFTLFQIFVNWLTASGLATELLRRNRARDVPTLTGKPRS